VLWLACLSSAEAQSFLTAPPPPKNEIITPKFVPALPTLGKPAGVVVQASFQQPVPAPGGKKDWSGSGETYVNTELPGPQRLFARDSETQFFERIKQDHKRENRVAEFPKEPIISKEWAEQLPSPRRDPLTKKPYEIPVKYVEPGYVCHGRLFFEQPNFERTGWNFGVLQPALCMGSFYYDLALLPYHAFSDLQGRYECSAGKCLPGDPAPLVLRRERFSVTGLVGQSGAVLGGFFLFP
jgi:hypothetical protein